MRRRAGENFSDTALSENRRAVEADDFDVATLIEFLSGSTTLYPGTVILTGTPSGVGATRLQPVFLKPGDEVTVEIDAIGRLTNPVLAEGS